MDLTLDQYLTEVDLWKSAAQSELDALSNNEQRARLLEVRRKIENTLNGPLHVMDGRSKYS